MTTKLHINLVQGIIDVEGDPAFVRSVYEDFKLQLATSSKPTKTAPERTVDVSEVEETPKAKPKGKRRAPAKRKGAEDDGGPQVNPDAPKLDKNLDTSKLNAFYSQFEPSNNPEKILVFLKFLIEELDVESPTTDQVYTCYERVNERVPKVFSQAFRDTQGRKFGYIDYNSPTDIRLTTVGNNHFKFDLKRKAAE